MIGKNAHVNAIYPLSQVDYITFGVGYCLLLTLGVQKLLETKVPHSSNINSSHASYYVTVRRER